MKLSLASSSCLRCLFGWLVGGATETYTLRPPDMPKIETEIGLWEDIVVVRGCLEFTSDIFVKDEAKRVSETLV